MECTINLCLNHPQTIPPPWSVATLSSTKPVPGVKKVGDCCLRAEREMKCDRTGNRAAITAHCQQDLLSRTLTLNKSVDHRRIPLIFRLKTKNLFQESCIRLTHHSKYHIRGLADSKIKLSLLRDRPYV